VFKILTIFVLSPRAVLETPASTPLSHVLLLIHALLLAASLPLANVLTLLSTVMITTTARLILVIHHLVVLTHLLFVPVLTIAHLISAITPQELVRTMLRAVMMDLSVLQTAATLF